MSRTTKTLASLAFILAALGIVGHYDYEDEVSQDQHYCDMVREGHWPAYKPEIDCKRIDQQHMVRGINYDAKSSQCNFARHSRRSSWAMAKTRARNLRSDEQCVMG